MEKGCLGKRQNTTRYTCLDSKADTCSQLQVLPSHFVQGKGQMWRVSLELRWVQRSLQPSLQTMGLPFDPDSFELELCLLTCIKLWDLRLSLVKGGPIFSSFSDIQQKGSVF